MLTIISVVMDVNKNWNTNNELLLIVILLFITNQLALLLESIIYLDKNNVAMARVTFGRHSSHWHSSDVKLSTLLDVVPSEVS